MCSTPPAGRHQPLMKHWRQVARRLVAFCGLDWEPACLEFHQGKQPVRTASVTQVRQPLSRRSVARWKHYERSLGALFASLHAVTDSSGR
jgi:hypothetical protein